MAAMDIGIFILSILQTIGAIIMSIVYSLETLILTLIPRSCRRCDVTGKIVLMTGGGSGIGRLVSQKLAKRGAIIVSWDVNAEANNETSKLIRDAGGKCYVYTVDLCDRHSIYKVADLVKKDVGKVDILINNAGIVTGRNFLDSPDELVIKTFEVNAICHFWTVKAFLPAMIEENSGHVVTIASMAGHFGINKLVDYCASKFAAVGFDESLRLELYSQGCTGIATTCVNPYYINTGMFEGVKSRLLPILEQDYVADEITDAILMKKRVLILPNFCNVLVALKGLMPYKSSLKVFHAMSGMTSLKRFSGHIKEEDQPQIEIMK